MGVLQSERCKGIKVPFAYERFVVIVGCLYDAVACATTLSQATVFSDLIDKKRVETCLFEPREAF